MKKFLSLLIVSMVVLASSCKFIESHNPFGRKAREQALKMQMDSIRIADSLQLATIRLAKEKVIQDSLLLIEAEKAYAAAHKYHIIVGSFLTPDYATAYASYFSGRGYESQIVDMTGGRFKLVSASSYDNIHDAWRALQGYKDTVEYEAWIYVSQ
jgi:hypothetical protein